MRLACAARCQREVLLHGSSAYRNSAVVNACLRADICYGPRRTRLVDLAVAAASRWQSSNASSRPRTKPNWISTRSAPGGPGTLTSPCPCWPWPGWPARKLMPQQGNQRGKAAPEPTGQAGCARRAETSIAAGASTRAAVVLVLKDYGVRTGERGITDMPIPSDKPLREDPPLPAAACQKSRPSSLRACTVGGLHPILVECAGGWRALDAREFPKACRACYGEGSRERRGLVTRPASRPTVQRRRRNQLAVPTAGPGSQTCRRHRLAGHPEAQRGQAGQGVAPLLPPQAGTGRPA